MGPGTTSSGDMAVASLGSEGGLAHAIIVSLGQLGNAREFIEEGLRVLKEGVVSRLRWQHESNVDIVINSLLTYEA